MNRIILSAEEATFRKTHSALPGPPAVAIAQAWDDLVDTKVTARRLARARVVTHDRRDPAHLAFDTLRTKLLRGIHENSWRTIAVTSPRKGCGSTCVVLNLAFSFLHLPQFRTIVLDVNFASPRTAAALALPRVRPLADVFAERAPVTAGIVRIGSRLAIGAQHSPTLGIADTLQGGNVDNAFDGIDRVLKPDLILVDAPPMLAGDDVLALLPHVDAALLVAGAGRSRMEEIDACERELAKGCAFAGLVLNKCRYLRGWNRG